MKLIHAAAIFIAIALGVIASFEHGIANAQAGCVRTAVGAGTVTGEWASDCLSPNRPISENGPGEGNYYARYYDFAVVQESEVTITLESSKDTYLYLLTGAGRNGEIIAENDDIDTDAENYNSRITVTLQPNDYSIETTTYNPAVAGEFTVTVSGNSIATLTPTPTPLPDDCATSIHFPLRDTVYGVEYGIAGGWHDGCLSENRPIDSDRPSDGIYYARYYTFSLNRAAEVTIRLGSDADSYLYLLEGEGRHGAVLYKNDDIDTDADNYNSRIAQTLQPGSYTIEATTYGVETAGFFALYVQVKDVDPSSLDIDRVALVALYNATDGDNWTNNTNWLSDAPLGEWHGVGTDGNGQVVWIGLYDNGLSGQIPPELGELSKLGGLELVRNELSGEIPDELGNLSELRRLSLFGNRLTGAIPWRLGNLSNLMHLSLGGNQLSGAIPPEIGNLSHLVELNLNDNRIGGEIPPELGRLTNLRTLSLVGNYLTGEIPPELSEISNPKALSLSYNLLTGEIPPELQYLDSLGYLELDNNRLTGSVPPELGNLTYLSILKLNSNELSGELPQSLTELRKLGEFRFDDNDGLCAPSGNEFQDWLLSIETVAGDTCAPPHLLDECVEPIDADSGANGAWTDECLSANRPADADRPNDGDYYARYYTFSLSAPSDVTITLESETDAYLYLLSDLGRDGHALHRNDDIDTHAGNYNSRISATLEAGYYTIEATTYDSDATGDFTLTLSGISGSESGDRYALTALYNATNGDDWWESENWLSDKPLNEWYGVTTDVHERVIRLHLEFNGLEGQIPPEIGNLSAMKVLHLGDNDLEGQMPAELGNLSGLQVLELFYNELTGEIPAELGNLPNLREMSLSSNELMGVIPAELGNLSSLQEMSLSYNELEGQIPAELGNLSNLQEMRLNSNELTGGIPSELGNLSSLRVLWLSSNELTGAIPPELAKLTSLEVLSLDNNRLTGKLPHSLTSLTLLRTLYFNDNAGLCAPKNFEIQEWLSSIEQVEGADCFSRPLMGGGIDLSVTFIERLPRYERYKIAYFDEGDCTYPFDEFMGAVVCPEQDGAKRWPDAGEPVELIAHVGNYGDWPSGPFRYRWSVDGETVAMDSHVGLEGGEQAAISLSMAWPDDNSNPLVMFEIDPEDDIEEWIEDNNVLGDWMKGYTIGFYFDPDAHESLMFPNDFESPDPFQSPEHWVHDNIDRLNELLTDAGLEDRIRGELFLVTNDKNPWRTHELRYYMDGWWGILSDTRIFTLEGSLDRPDIDYGLLHELLHQLGVIDLYRMRPGIDNILLDDVNRPGHKAGCGLDYWNYGWNCYEFPKGIGDIMSGSPDRIVGAHTAGGLRSNAGHRRGFYGEYLYDTPESTSVRVLDTDGSPMPDVSLRFYQYEMQPEGHILDATPEFALTTDASGVVVLPNRGITGIVTATGHQLKPNPFGHIDVVGTNGTFIIEMEGASCTNYEWLTLVELNLAYWDGQTDSATFDKTLRCPPPSGSGAPSGIPSDAGIEDRLPPPYSPYTQFAPQTDSRSTPAR